MRLSLRHIKRRCVCPYRILSQTGIIVKVKYIFCPWHTTNSFDVTYFARARKANIMRASYLRMLTHEGGGTIPGCLMSLCVRPSELVNVISSDKVSPGQKRETNSCRLFADKIQDKNNLYVLFATSFWRMQRWKNKPWPWVWFKLKCLSKLMFSD